MKDLLIRWFSAFNAFLIRASKGTWGTRLGTQLILLLHSVGRKSGQLYVTPIAYFYLNGYYFVVASNWGKDANAGWYHNLRANPRARIDVDGRELEVMAREAQGREYAQLWTHAVERHPPYAEYQKKTKRQIPIVIFEPVK